jgi:hypothetical protein
MSCTCKSAASLAANPMPEPVWIDRPAFAKTIITIAAAFQEALAMRRTVQQSHPFEDQ